MNKKGQRWVATVGGGGFGGYGGKRKRGVARGKGAMRVAQVIERRECAMVGLSRMCVKAGGEGGGKGDYMGD